MTRHTVHVDGSCVAERLLEGVTFDVTVDVVSDTEFNVVSVEINPHDADYFSDLNEAKWLAAMKDEVEDDPYLVWEQLEKRA